MKKARFSLTFVVVMAAMIVVCAGETAAKEFELPPFNSANFNNPQDNVYMPMSMRGKTYVYEAETEDEFIHNEISYSDIGTNLEILGVMCMVVSDVEDVYVDGIGWITTEETTDWYAWDNDGNFWYFGEDTVAHEYDDEWNYLGDTKEGSWKAGVNDAEPGIIMLADPQPGLSYQQEYYEGEAEDMGKVLRLNAKVSIDYDDYEDCLATKEWTPLSPGVVEHKYYAPDIGLVFIEELKEKTVRVELVDRY